MSTKIKENLILAQMKKLNGAAIGTFDTTTEVKLTGGKKNPMLGHVTKKVKGVNVIVYCNINGNTYQNMINKRLAKEGKESNFQPHSRAWGERVPNTPFILHKGQMYLEAICLKSPKNVTYYLDGVEIEKEKIEGLPKKKEGEQGGLEDKVIIRDYKLESIDNINMGELSV